MVPSITNHVALITVIRSLTLIACFAGSTQSVKLCFSGGSAYFTKVFLHDVANLIIKTHAVSHADVSARRVVDQSLRAQAYVSVGSLDCSVFQPKCIVSQESFHCLTQVLQKPYVLC